MFKTQNGDEELNKDLLDGEPYGLTNANDETYEESKDGQQPKKKRKKHAVYGRLFINVNYCHYPVVRTVAKMHKIKLTYSDEEDWDIYWSDGA